MSGARLSDVVLEGAADPASATTAESVVLGLLVKGSYATGLAHAESDLDLWVVTESGRPPILGQFTPAVVDFLQPRFPDAFTFDPLVEIDVVGRAEFTATWSEAAKLVAGRALPHQDDVELVHEVSSSLWVVGTAAGLGLPPLPAGHDLAATIACWHRLRATNMVAGYEGTTSSLCALAPGRLRLAIDAMCCALLAEHGLDNPKRKWRNGQAVRLHLPVGAAVRDALRNLDEDRPQEVLATTYMTLASL